MTKLRPDRRKVFKDVSLVNTVGLTHKIWMSRLFPSLYSKVQNRQRLAMLVMVLYESPKSKLGAEHLRNRMFRFDEVRLNATGHKVEHFLVLPYVKMADRASVGE